MYIIGPRPSADAERVDLVPYVKEGLFYREAPLPVWRIEGRAAAAKLAARGYRLSQSYIPPSVRPYLEGRRSPRLGGRVASFYLDRGVVHWRMGGEAWKGGCPQADYVASWGQPPPCPGLWVDLRRIYRRHLWLEAAERMGDAWLLKAARRRPEDAADAVHALAAEAVAFLEALAAATGIGVDAILDVLERNSVAAVAEAVFHWEAERRGYVLEDSRRLFDMPYFDMARGGKPGVYRGVAEFDFRSLFPSLAVKLGVDPTTARPCAGGYCFDGGPIADVIKRWLEARLRTGDKRLSEALKWLMNAGIGAWGKAGWGIVCEVCLLAVRGAAASLFDEAWRRLKPIYGDTDSIYVESSRAGDVAQWASALDGLTLELRGVWDVFILAPARGGGAAEKNYIKAGGGVFEAKGGLLRPHDLPLAVRLRYREVVEAALAGRDPADAAAEILRAAPPEQLFVYRAVEVRRLAGLKRRGALHTAALYLARRCGGCEVVDVFYVPDGDLVYVPWAAVDRRLAARPADEREVRAAAVSYIRRLWKLKALRLASGGQMKIVI
ncbi:DNA-directed DNA polymerase [Pyrobaculum neutrophilum]|uniref:DNA-directed DNA polymerase n=1 Tax=Pyrobaculum neutrophilum TaxID=70771 RepID=UPI000320F847|nr:DNA-directed DNA polymerase [Pyrobaculum neutrophilum]